MPSLADFQKEKYIKMLLIGESKAGKTAALASLVRAGFKIIILDFDANLDFLVETLQETNPELLSNVYYETLIDETKLTQSRDVVLKGKAKAYDKAQKILDKGITLSDGSESGPTKDLGQDWIIVVDSLWAAGRAAFNEHVKMQAAKDPRQNYFGAQSMVMGLLQNFKEPEFHCHVIVISHMTLVDMENGVSRFFPSAIGKAICVDIPKVFPRMLVCEIKGSGKNARRVISTVPTSLLPAASALPTGKIDSELPTETGLATYFAACGVTATKNS